MLVGAVGLHVRVVVGTVDVIPGLLDRKKKTSSLAYLLLIPKIWFYIWMCIYVCISLLNDGYRKVGIEQGRGRGLG